MALPRASTNPPAGTSSFTFEGRRTASYPSYWWNGTRSIEYDVSPECHQAVLNEIAARPSDFGLGAGYALKVFFGFMKNLLRGYRRPNSVCLLEGRPQEEAMTRMEACATSTENLLKRLSTVERAGEAFVHCLESKGLSAREARAMQREQRPVFDQTYETLFDTVENGPYKVRRELCKEEATWAVMANREAEAAERDQRETCRFLF